MGSLSNIALNVGSTRKKSAEVVDLITFVESSWGLNQKLYPVQRVILKIHYGLALDDNPYDLDLSQPVPEDHPEYDQITMPTGQWRGLYKHVVPVSDWRRERQRYMSEADYLRYLYDSGRCNIREVVPGRELRVMVLSVGRRSGKTQMASIISAYETYKLILKSDPQSYYGLPVGEPIQLVSVATDKEQAGILYSKVAGYYKECPFFGPYTANNTMSYARFQTPADIERYGRWSDNEKANATIRVTFRPCRAKGLRGAGNLVAILDEMAHFTDSGQSSADQVYNAIKPSLSAFSQKDPDDATFPIGEVEGRMICISSPLGRQGMFYKLFQLAMAGAPNMLAIQAPTWEVNPTVPVDEFEQNYRADPTVFFTEYGGEFTDRTRGWIENPQDLFDCIDGVRRPANRALARQAHFVGIDFALKDDGSAIAIGHLEQDHIVLDLVDYIKAGEGDFADCERLEFDTVADWVLELSKRFLFRKGIFDQWSGIPFEQALHKRGLTMLETVHFTDPLSSQLFRNFKDMMWDKRIVLYDWPLPEPGDATADEHCPYIMEMLGLQAEYKSKYVTKVRAPNIKGRHDDMSDAIVRMIWVASQNLAKPKHISGSRPRRGQQAQNPIKQHQARLRAKRPGGSSPDRQPSNVMRGRTRGR